MFRFVIQEHQRQLSRWQKLKDYYMVRNRAEVADTAGAVSVVVPYPRYIVDVILGYYLGDPVKYDTKDERQDQTLNPGAIRATVRNGAVVRASLTDSEIDITPVVSAYNDQTIAEVDAKIGKDMGICGEAYELCYASDDPVPVPKSVEYDPRCAIMVRDTTVEHHKLFFMVYEKRKRVNGEEYYAVRVYTDRTCKTYHSSGTSLMTASFTDVPEEEAPHFFGEVPAIEYQNNAERMGDFEAVLSLIDAYNQLMSDRVTDKNKFIDAILALFGMSLSEDQIAKLKEHKMLDELPIEGRIEYIQKMLDETSVQVLADSISTEIHKQSMTVDMTDENFAGNSSGQALKLKLMTMNMLVKNKIRNFEKGLRKRFEMYNHWLAAQNVMPIVSKNAVEPVFTIAMPINEAEIVQMVTSLQNIVDDETLLNQLWFVKDAKSILEKVKAQKEEKQRAYLDTFGITARNEENIGGDYENIRQKEKEPDAVEAEEGYKEE